MKVSLVYVLELLQMYTCITPQNAIIDMLVGDADGQMRT